MRSPGVHRRAVITRLMPAFPRFAVLFRIALLVGPLAGAGQAAELPHHAQPARHTCLTKAEQRAAVASRRAISLAEAIESVRRHRKKKPEVLRARLCRHGDRLVYVLTLLAPNGKVTRATVDAANGVLIKGHVKGHETAASGEKRLAPPRRRGRSRP